jgi:hypothetical protein
MLRRMGISEAQFQEELTREVDEALLEAAAKRRQTAAAQEASSSTETPKVVTKEFILQYFAKHGYPGLEPMLGVWCWAADIGHTRFNFDLGFDPESLKLLDAYD